MFLGGHNGLTLVEALLCACLIMVIVMVSVAPKLLCRWCHHNKESHNEYEDEVIYGEVRHRDEPHRKHMHTTHCSNALYHKSNESTNGNRYIVSVALPKDNNIPTCERSVNQTPDIPPDNNEKITMTSESLQMIENQSQHLEKKTNTNDNKVVNKREATHTPEVPSYYGSDMDDDEDDDDYVTMTQNPSYFHIEDATVNHTELVPTVCEGETNYTHTLDASLYDDDGTTMNRNPSYNLGRDFFTAANTLDSVKLLPTCKRETNLTPHISPYNDSDCVGVTQMPSCSLDKKFSAEPNKISAAADYIASIPSHNSKHSHNAIKMTDVNTNGIIMTNNPSYQHEKDFYDEQ